MGKEEHKTVWEGKYLRVKVCGRWEYAERPNSPAGVVIAALSEKGLILTEQFRIPIQKNVIELPAGLVGDDHSQESFLEAAKRELQEETGYEAEEWEQVAFGPPSAGLSNEMVAIFRARKLHRSGKGGGEGEHEKIEVHEVPLVEVEAWLKEKEKSGAVVDPKIFAGIYFLR